MNNFELIKKQLEIADTSIRKQKIEQFNNNYNILHNDLGNENYAKGQVERLKYDNNSAGMVLESRHELFKDNYQGLHKGYCSAFSASIGKPPEGEFVGKNGKRTDSADFLTEAWKKIKSVEYSNYTTIFSMGKEHRFMYDFVVWSLSKTKQLDIINQKEKLDKKETMFSFQFHITDPRSVYFHPGWSPDKSIDDIPFFGIEFLKYKSTVSYWIDSLNTKYINKDIALKIKTESKKITDDQTVTYSNKDKAKTEIESRGEMTFFEWYPIIDGERKYVIFERQIGILYEEPQKNRLNYKGIGMIPYAIDSLSKPSQSIYTRSKMTAINGKVEILARLESLIAILSDKKATPTIFYNSEIISQEDLKNSREIFKAVVPIDGKSSIEGAVTEFSGGDLYPSIHAIPIIKKGLAEESFITDIDTSTSNTERATVHQTNKETRQLYHDQITVMQNAAEARLMVIFLILLETTGLQEKIKLFGANNLVFELDVSTNSVKYNDYGIRVVSHQEALFEKQREQAQQVQFLTMLSQGGFPLASPQAISRGLKKLGEASSLEKGEVETIIEGENKVNNEEKAEQAIENIMVGNDWNIIIIPEYADENYVGTITSFIATGKQNKQITPLQESNLEKLLIKSFKIVSQNMLKRVQLEQQQQLQQQTAGEEQTQDPFSAGVNQQQNKI